MEISVLVVLVMFFALAFDYINGFHDTANAIATVVSTRVLSPRNAILMAAVLNFGGAVIHTGVAKTVSSGLVDNTGISQTSDSRRPDRRDLLEPVHLVLRHSQQLVARLDRRHLRHGDGPCRQQRHHLVHGPQARRLAPGRTAVQGHHPDCRFAHRGVYRRLHGDDVDLYASPPNAPRSHRPRFRYMQILSSATMAGMHGSNDAQKSMGIITMALAAFEIGNTGPSTVRTRRFPLAMQNPEVRTWVMLSCAIAMAMGTAAGGWRIIRTMGHRIIKLEPVHGFAAETSASIIILIADLFEAPISTTHTISGRIFGVGASSGCRPSAGPSPNRWSWPGCSHFPPQASSRRLSAITCLPGWVFNKLLAFAACKHAAAPPLAVLPSRLTRGVGWNVAMSRFHSRRDGPRLNLERLESRQLLAVGDPLLPDFTAWADPARQYVHGWTIDTREIPNHVLLRLSTATPNIGRGPIELQGGAILPGGEQEVNQRVHLEGGGITERLAGTFIHHPEHGHIHFEGFAEYSLRTVLPGDGVGDVVASGGKTSFCLLDVVPYNTSLPGAPQSAQYDGCDDFQGISVGWSDVYDRALPDQWIDITGLAPQRYWLEVTVDPDDHLLSSTKRTTRRGF